MSKMSIDDVICTNLNESVPPPIGHRGIIRMYTLRNRAMPATYFMVNRGTYSRMGHYNLWTAYCFNSYEGSLVVKKGVPNIWLRKRGGTDRYFYEFY